MKKLVIQNLKDAFDFGLSFKDLALLEDAFLKSEDFCSVVECESLRLEFISGTVKQNGSKVMYYKFIPLF